MNDQLPITLVRLAIAVLVLRQVGLKTFTEAFRTIEREVLRGAPDLPADSDHKKVVTMTTFLLALAMSIALAVLATYRPPCA